MICKTTDIDSWYFCKQICTRVVPISHGLQRVKTKYLNGLLKDFTDIKHRVRLFILITKNKIKRLPGNAILLMLQRLNNVVWYYINVSDFQCITFA
jgi:hypothetical protein